MNAVKNEVLECICKELSLKLKHSELKLVDIAKNDSFIKEHSNVFISLNSYYLINHFISIASYEDHESPTEHTIYISLMRLSEVTPSTHPAAINTVRFHLPETKTETINRILVELKNLLLECIL